ncbi:MAG: site-2 protease family protein [Planctomycetota bacterium]|nr:site-2 protease family protein [Planctomycetota bacterium]
MSWWVHDYWNAGQYMLLISWTFWVILSITLHELAHGWAAIWQGDDTPIRYQRMTMNPVVHMGWYSLLIFAIIGIAWGVMPTDPSRYRWKRKGRIIVSGAGPAMNVLLAFLSLTGAGFLAAWGPTQVNWSDNLSIFLITGGWLNIVLAVFNMLPIPPLDGASVLSGFSLRAYRFFQNDQAQMFGMFIVLAIFFSGFGGLIFSLAITMSYKYVHGLANLLP